MRLPWLAALLSLAACAGPVDTDPDCPRKVGTLETDIVESITVDDLACSVDNDCTSFRVESACLTSCPLAVSKTALADVEARAKALTDERCPALSCSDSSNCLPVQVRCDGSQCVTQLAQDG